MPLIPPCCGVGACWARPPTLPQSRQIKAPQTTPRLRKRKYPFWVQCIVQRWRLRQPLARLQEQCDGNMLRGWHPTSGGQADESPGQDTSQRTESERKRTRTQDPLRSLRTLCGCCFFLARFKVGVHAGRLSHLGMGSYVSE